MGGRGRGRDKVREKERKGHRRKNERKQRVGHGKYQILPSVVCSLQLYDVHDLTFVLCVYSKPCSVEYHAPTAMYFRIFPGIFTGRVESGRLTRPNR